MKCIETSMASRREAIFENNKKLIKTKYPARAWK